MPLSWRSWIANEGSKHFILVLWLSTNIALFWKTFVSYCSGPQHYYLHKMLGLGLCMSRASAAVLNLNCCLVLLPVCRSLLAGLRGFQKVTSRKARRILDKRKTFHMACGIAIGLFSVIHVSAHLANVYSFSAWYSDEFPALNLARHRGEDPRIIMFTTVPGATGVLLVLVLFLMFTASSYSMRVSHYDIFWYTHNLSIVFYVLLLVHVIGGVLKYQTNVEHHPPDCFRPNRTAPGGQSSGFVNSSQVDGLSKVCREEPQFQAHFPETWLWVSGPLCLYCAERLYRYMRGCRPVTVASVVRHPCRVVEVHMQKSGFRARPGQYIVLNCPHVSSFESHPFTLTTCPTERNATFGIHLRVLGDWTERFTDLLLAEPEVGAEILPVALQRRYPRVYVDGPFGSPSEDVFNYEVSVCVAGGIGVTPFASVLQALLDDWQHHKLRRLYFIWVCRELQSFCWFAELLCSLHQKLWQENRPDYLNIRLYVSKERGLQSLSEGRYQVLSARLLIGRPRWEMLFEEIGRANKQKRVGVFCSGPKGLSTTLHKMCNSNHFGATFEYNKESFS
ncbi:NADPH oxidase 4 isoform X1 [Paramormyrops kingsleyae]|uniref:NADPH oxidase 4 isoform X1 n=2 Tax=Paramormyrops kingsleyae TaxID=1676925 RepID=UPI003B96A624